MRKIKRRLPKPYYETSLGKLYHGDCIDIIPYLPKINLVITSPPYDNLRDYKGYNFNFKKIANLVYKKVKYGGVIIWVVGDAVINNSETGTSFKQALYFKRLGLNLHDTMIYAKNSAPQPSVNRYEQVIEYMFVLSKGIPKTVNLIKDKPNKNVGVSKITTHRQKDGSMKSRRNKPIQAFGIRENIWRYSTGMNMTTKDKIAYQHPAIFPEKLVQDHIISWSNEGNLVLDPMCGSGTTLKIAELLNRRWIGIEESKKYCDIIVKRIQEYSKISYLF